MSLSTRVLVALGAGLAAGLVLTTIDPHVARSIVAVVEPAGTLFVNAIRMTVLPLVVASIVAGIVDSGDGTSVARLGGRAIVVFVGLLIASGLIGAFVSPPVLSHVALDSAAVERVRAAATTPDIAIGASSIQSSSEWLVSIVPANAVKALTDGAILPLVVFSLLLGLALLHVDQSRRSRAVAVFRGISESMLVIVRWVLAVAPIGVFALALPLTARLGLGAVGALATYVVLVSLAAFVFTVGVLYPAAVWFGGVSLREFAWAALPAQAVGFSSRSSVASLPAVIETARTRLHLSDEITGFFLPLATVVFRVGAALGLTTGAVFIARLYGITVTPTQVATIVVTAIATSFGIPGIPGGSIIAMVPVLQSVGLPIAGIGILLGVDTIPDMFRTTANVTGQLTAAVIVGRRKA